MKEKRDSNRPQFRVVSDYEAEESGKWKLVPGYPYCVRANENGDIILKHKVWERWFYTKLYEVPTSVGTYINARVPINADGDMRERGSHVLVCLAYHGLPPQDGQKYEVNHKDGDKHNNHKDNLEWMTRRENCLHAINSGLRKDNVVITVEDIATGEKRDYNSINQLAKDWGIPRYNLYALIGRHKETPYEGRYKFHYDPATLHQVTRKLARQVMAWDYVNECWLMADSLNGLSLATGIGPFSIRHQLRKQSTTIVGGYLFRVVGDTGNKPAMDKETARASRELYWSKEFEDKVRRGVVCYDHVDNKELYFPDRKTASKALGLKAGRISAFINDGDCALINGYSFKNEGDPTPFKKYTEVQAWLSRNGQRFDAKVFDVTHSGKNTTERIVGKGPLASYFGYDASKSHVRIDVLTYIKRDFPEYQITLVN